VSNKIFSDNERTLYDEITTMIHEIRYGEVVISIHNSEVVQIEKREKKRFNHKKTEKSEY
jgi:hypothetical protein